MQTPEGVTTQMYKVVSVASESLRNATDALWDSVISETVEKSKQITSLTGDAYTQAVDALINQQMDKIQNATHASSDEMEAFQETLTKVLTTIISDAQDCNAELARIEEELSSFFGGTMQMRWLSKLILPNWAWRSYINWWRILMDPP